MRRECEKNIRETREGKVRRERREREETSWWWLRGREEKRTRRRKNCKSGGGREIVCRAAGGRPSVHCKSPSTAFNYDVIANTDDGYFLRYTLYITRGPTKPSLESRAVRYCVYIRRTND